ncbi:uncharacterized protein LOC144565614 isoform X1 [Carex rostrata]
MLVEGAADKENIDGDTEGLQINYEDASTSTKFHNPSDFSRWINGTDINQMDARELDEFEATLLEAFRQIKHRKIALEGRKAGVNIDEATIAQGEVAPLLD